MLNTLKKGVRYIINKTIEIIERYEYRNLPLDETDANKKVLQTLSNVTLKVNTDSGFKHASEIHLTQPFTVFNIKLENGLNIDCADTHIFYDSNMKEVFCYNLKVGNRIQTKFGLSKITKITKKGYKQSMFDLSIDTYEHRYYTNDILSHNTINSAITILHYVTFNNDKNVMIVANVAATTIEIIDKIKNIYVLLPFFLKNGIKNWNQKSIIFGNGCRIKSAARSKTPAIGFTIDFLYMDEFAHIPSNIIEPYYTAAYPTVSAIKNSKIIITSTPNGMNLFHKLLEAAELPEGDPLKSEFVAMKVYWHQVPGRFVTYIKMNPYKMRILNINRHDVFRQIQEKFGDRTKVEMESLDGGVKYNINVFNNKDVTEEMVSESTIISNGVEYSLFKFAEVSTWKKDAIKNIGGEGAFNQEYNLRFVNASRSLLEEEIIDRILENKEEYVFRPIDILDSKLKWMYEDLKWINTDAFYEIDRKITNIFISIDISEGLGQDYSVINIFKLSPKPDDIIERFKSEYQHISDFYRLEQIGIFRSNCVSVKQLSEIFYLLAFEYFDPELVRATVEINGPGQQFLAYLPKLYDGDNDYGSFIFTRHKHKIDSEVEKVGIRVTSGNKNIMVKDYQKYLSNFSIHVSNPDNIKEITTFVKHVTPSGNVKYAADTGHDDTVMTLVNICTLFEKDSFKEIVAEYSETHDYHNNQRFNNILNDLNDDGEYGIDYGGFLKAKNSVQKRTASTYKSKYNQWKNLNNKSW